MPWQPHISHVTDLPHTLNILPTSRRRYFLRVSQPWPSTVPLVSATSATSPRTSQPPSVNRPNRKWRVQIVTMFITNIYSSVTLPLVVPNTPPSTSFSNNLNFMFVAQSDRQSTVWTKNFCVTKRKCSAFRTIKWINNYLRESSILTRAPFIVIFTYSFSSSYNILN